MSDIKFEYPTGATELYPDDLNGLIPDYISTQGELNALEQNNISEAIVWASKQALDDLLTASFIHALHKKMYGKVWKWAGRARTTDTIPGIDYHKIMTELGELLGSVDYWISNKTFSLEEVAVRFHHRLVQIHVFPNGNGRHARLMTDLFLRAHGIPEFTWGGKNNPSPMDVQNERRMKYIRALQEADKGHFESLKNFVRS